MKKVSDKELTNFQNPWCLYECDYRNEDTCEWTETGNCPYYRETRKIIEVPRKLGTRGRR